MFLQNSVPYRIETVRTIIRCWNPKDAAMMQEAIDVSVDSLLPWLPWANGDFQDLQISVILRDDYRNSDIRNDEIKVFNAMDELIAMQN